MVANDLIGYAKRFVKGIEVNDETLAVDLIKQVGPGGNFLTEAHTVMNMMNEFYEPDLADRTLYEEWVSSGRNTIKDRARQKLNALMASHNPHYISEDQEEEIRSRFKEIQD